MLDIVTKDFEIYDDKRKQIEKEVKELLKKRNKKTRNRRAIKRNRDKRPSHIRTVY